MTKSKVNPPVFWGAVFEDLYHSLMKNEQAKAVIQKITERSCTVKDSGATHRLINHWTAEGIIQDHREVEGKGWRKFSLCEILWIKTALEMRDFGLPLEVIRNAYRSLFYNHDGAYSPHEFTCAAFLCVNKPVHAVFVVILKDGTAKLATYETIKEQEKINGVGASYLRINLNEIIRSATMSDEFVPSNPDSIFLDQSEQHVLSAVRDHDCSQVNIRKKNGKVDLVEKTRNLEGSQKLHELLMSTNYGEVTFKIEGGKVKSTKHTTKRKST